MRNLQKILVKKSMKKKFLGKNEKKKKIKILIIKYIIYLINIKYI